MRVTRIAGLSFIAVGATALVALMTGLVLALDTPDVRVTTDATPGSYVRYDGGTDATLQACSTGRRSQVEPAIAVNPRDLDVVVSASNDGCRAAGTNTFGNWPGYYRSTDGGMSWQNSLVPGYPDDNSPAGLASPARGFCTRGGDSTQSFDREGRLFFAFLCFNSFNETPDEPFNSSILVATYDDDGAHYLRTVLVAKGTPAPAGLTTGLAHDKPNLVTDQTSGPGDGNVYVAWTSETGNASARLNAIVQFSRSTDHGATFSQPVPVVAGVKGGLFTDLAVGPDGAVYLVWRTILASEDEPRDSIWLTRSTDFGRSFGPPQLVATFDVFDSFLFSGSDAVYACSLLRPCATGYTFAIFMSIPAVTADAAGVHVVWSARAEDGQGKIFVRNSPDGLSWVAPPQQIDSVPTGHQWMPDVVSADGRITVLFFDSRDDPAYSPAVPPGNTASGQNSGNVVNAWRAVSIDGGITWLEERVSRKAFNPNWITSANLTPFAGDYLYASAVPGRVWAAWSDPRDIVPAIPALFFPLVTCDLENVPPSTDVCFSQGGLDWNIYARRLEP